MNCQKMETQMIAWLDGKATETERREVELHLIACSDCRARAEEFRRVWNVLDEAPAIEPSRGFDAQVRQRVAAEPRPGLFAWLPQPRFALATAALIALAIWLSAVPPTVEVAQTPDEEFQMIQNLPVLEDYEVLANFEPLDQLPAEKQEKVDR
jgi:anti-sigma factor RsiW